MRRCFLVLLACWACAPAASAQTTSALLDSVQATGFQYFWNEANPSNGMVRDRSQPDSPASIAAVGFGLSSICIGIDHGWVTRAAGRDRVLTTLQTFWNGPQGSGETGTIGYRGLFYHFLDMSTATRAWTSELSTIDTALLLAGILDAKQYFTQADASEVQIRALADSIYRRCDWNFTRNNGPGIRMGWDPEHGFQNFGTWTGYNEAMIMYILAIGSPTHPVPATNWTTWKSTYQWQTHYGYSFLNFPPLFGHQYSHCWIDFRGIQDSYMQIQGITYFENSRRATLAQRAYAIANPSHFVGYSDSLWGLTASDVPSGYNARGAPPAMNDDGTITPTAPISSIAFAPEVVIPVIRNMYNTYHSQLWTRYGFRDAFNLSGTPWWDTDVLGIDQGPIVMMIENYLNSAVWIRFMANPDIQLGLTRAGFVAVAGVEGPQPGIGEVVTLESDPNPFSIQTTIRYRLPRAERVRLTVYDITGRQVAQLVDGLQSAGSHEATLRSGSLATGVYHCRLEREGAPIFRNLIVLK